MIDECALVLPASLWLPADERGIPVGGPEDITGTPLDFRDPRPVGATRLDHTLTGLARDDGGRAWARLTDSRRQVSLWVGDGYGWFQVFTGDTLASGRRRRALAVEPMTCPPNAFVTGADLIMLDPGTSVSHVWGIMVDAGSVAAPAVAQKEREEPVGQQHVNDERLIPPAQRRRRSQPAAAGENGPITTNCRTKAPIASLASMSKLSLRAAFTLAQQSAVAAQQVFTNRVSEIAAFDASLESLQRSLSVAELSPVIDRSLPRTNVLVYFGVGGIGKTALSQEIEKRFTNHDQVSTKRARATIRFDFAETAASDIESYVLQLRAGLGHLARSWPVFDIAFGVYWERAHPGVPLEEFINHDSILRRVARSVGLSEQISSTLVDIAGVALPGAAKAVQAIGGLLYGQAKKAVVRHRILSECELLSDLLDTAADFDTLSYFPYLLAWELDRLPPPQVKVMVLLDTFEEVTSRNTRDTERWLQRSVFLMPNVLFVITGRDRIDWADLVRTDELDFVGVQR